MKLKLLGIACMLTLTTIPLSAREDMRRSLDGPQSNKGDVRRVRDGMQGRPIVVFLRHLIFGI